MSDAREALAALIRRAMLSNAAHMRPVESVVADAILASFDVTPRGEDARDDASDTRRVPVPGLPLELDIWYEPEWEYGVRWGDEPEDSRPAICDSRAHAESRAAESHGDKIVRRIAARTIPAGEWEEVPRG